MIPIKIKYIIANNLYHHHPVTYTWNENQFWARINYNSFNNIWIEDQQIVEDQEGIKSRLWKKIIIEVLYKYVKLKLV